MNISQWKNADRIFFSLEVDDRLLLIATHLVIREVGGLLPLLCVHLPAQPRNLRGQVRHLGPQRAQEVALVLELPLRSSATFNTLLYFFWVTI